LPVLQVLQGFTELFLKPLSFGWIGPGRNQCQSPGQFIRRTGVTVRCRIDIPGCAQTGIAFKQVKPAAAFRRLPAADLLIGDPLVVVPVGMRPEPIQLHACTSGQHQRQKESHDDGASQPNRSALRVVGHVRFHPQSLSGSAPTALSAWMLSMAFRGASAGEKGMLGNRKSFFNREPMKGPSIIQSAGLIRYNLGFFLRSRWMENNFSLTASKMNSPGEIPLDLQ
jgi:hypothetical protein